MRFPDTPNILDADAAEELLRFFDKFPVLKIAGFSLWTFDSMTPEAAKVIAASRMDILFLDSVKVVSPEVIRILAESNVSYLTLGGLEEVSPEAATILSRFPKLLSFGGIKTLSVDVAKALARHRGELMRDGLTVKTLARHF